MKPLPADQSLEARLIAGLGKVGLALRSRAQQGATARGLSPTQGQILALLRRRGAAQLQTIAEGLAVTPPTVSEAAAVLVTKGLVSRRTSAADGRAAVFTLTHRGRAEAERALRWTDFMAEAVEGLSVEDREALLRILVNLVATLQRRGEIPLSGMCTSCTFFRRDAHPGTSQPHHCAFIDAPLGRSDLRFECPDHQLAATP